MADKPTLDRVQIQHIAALASLTLTDAEAEQMTHEIGAIVRYVEQLNQLDVSDVPPTAHVQLDRADWRVDQLEPSLSHEEALSQAPRTGEGGFAVPKFVEV